MTTMRRVLGLLLPALFVVTVPMTTSATAERPAAKGGHVYPDFAPQAGDPAALRQAWRDWEGLEADHYVLRVDNACFCPDKPAVETTVDDGEVDSVRYQGHTRDLNRKGYDMDRLYLILRDAYAHADAVDVRYSARGVPNRITIDWNLMIADEEAYYTVGLGGLHG